MYSNYGIAFHGADSCSYGNELLKDVAFFGADNSLLSHSDNHKNNFSELGEGPTDDINDSAGAAVEMFSISFTKGKTKFCFSKSI